MWQCEACDAQWSQLVVEAYGLTTPTLWRILQKQLVSVNDAHIVQDVKYIFY